MAAILTGAVPEENIWGNARSNRGAKGGRIEGVGTRVSGGAS